MQNFKLLIGHTWFYHSAPVAAGEAAVWHGFGEVLGEDAIGLIEIGNSGGDFEEPVVGAGAGA